MLSDPELIGAVVRRRQETLLAEARAEALARHARRGRRLPEALVHLLSRWSRLHPSKAMAALTEAS